MNDQSHKKVLIVSYVFPPMAAVGGFRVIKACKFLPRFNWQPVVLTVEGGLNYAYDQESLKRIEGSVKIYRAGYFSPFEWWDKRTMVETPPVSASLSENQGEGIKQTQSVGGRIKSYIRTVCSVPDAQNFWIPSAVIKGLKAVKAEKIDLIMSTSPPASSHIAALLISYLSGVPLVSDFRDLWTQNESYHNRKLPALFKLSDRCWEKRVINRSRAVVSATTGFSEELYSNNKKPRENFHAVTNGVDPDDFKDINFSESKTEKFNILHLGSLYGNRNPEYFFILIRKWQENRPEISDKVVVEMIGNAPGYDKVLNGTPLEKIIKFKKHIPQSEVLPRLWKSDLLLLLLGFDPAGKNVMPAKLYEYISTNRQILALIPEGMAADAIRKYDRGYVMSSETFGGAIKFLNKNFDRWKNDPTPLKSEFVLPEEYDRCRQNEKLAAIFDEIVKK